MQSKDRIHRLVRPGEVTNQKTIYDLVCIEDSIDEGIVANLEKKKNNKWKYLGNKKRFKTQLHNVLYDII